VLRKVTALGRSSRMNLPPIYSPIFGGATLWYERWYFMLRLEEEVARALRHNIALSVVVFRLEDDMSETGIGLEESLRTIALKKLRKSDLPAVLEDRGLGLCLTHTNPEQAEVVVNRVMRTLRPFRAWSGLSSLPADGSDSETLFLMARHHAMREAAQAGLGVGPIPHRDA